MRGDHRFRSCGPRACALRGDRPTPSLLLLTDVMNDDHDDDHGHVVPYDEDASGICPMDQSSTPPPPPPEESVPLVHAPGSTPRESTPTAGGSTPGVDSRAAAPGVNSRAAAPGVDSRVTPGCPPPQGTPQGIPPDIDSPEGTLTAAGAAVRVPSSAGTCSTKNGDRLPDTAPSTIVPVSSVANPGKRLLTKIPSDLWPSPHDPHQPQPQPQQSRIKRRRLVFPQPPDSIRKKKKTEEKEKEEEEEEEQNVEEEDRDVDMVDTSSASCHTTRGFDRKSPSLKIPSQDSQHTCPHHHHHHQQQQRQQQQQQQHHLQPQNLFQDYPAAMVDQMRFMSSFFPRSSSLD